MKPIIKYKYKDGTYHKDSFYGSSNININPIMCKDKIVILSKIQSYIFYWYHTYLFHPIMDKAEAMICQYLYWPDIRYSICKEVTYCETCQCTKRSNKKYDKLLAKLAE